MAGHIIAKFRGISYPSVCRAILMPPTELKRFVENQAPTNTIRAIRTITNIINSRSPSNQTKAEYPAIGIKKRGIREKDRIKIGHEIRLVYVGDGE